MSARSRGQRLINAGAMLLISGAVSYASSTLIAARYPDRPMPRDLLFELLPFIDSAQYLTDIAVLASLVLLVIYGVRRVPEKAPELMAQVALYYTLRAVIMALTPLAGAHGKGYFGFIHAIQNGAFPSGHAGMVTLAFLLVDAQVAPRLRKVMLALAVAEWVSMLVSHGHYSIDIVGGMLLAYFVQREWANGTWFNGLKRLVEA